MNIPHTLDTICVSCSPRQWRGHSDGVLPPREYTTLSISLSVLGVRGKPREQFRIEIPSNTTVRGVVDAMQMQLSVISAKLALEGK